MRVVERGEIARRACAKFVMSRTAILQTCERQERESIDVSRLCVIFYSTFIHGIAAMKE